VRPVFYEDQALSLASVKRVLGVSGCAVCNVLRALCSEGALCTGALCAGAVPAVLPSEHSIVFMCARTHKGHIVPWSCSCSQLASAVLRGRTVYGRPVRWRCACRTALGAFNCVYARTHKGHIVPMVVFVLAACERGPRRPQGCVASDETRLFLLKPLSGRRHASAAWRASSQSRLLPRTGQTRRTATRERIRRFRVRWARTHAKPVYPALTRTLPASRCLARQALLKLLFDGSCWSSTAFAEAAAESFLLRLECFC